MTRDSKPPNLGSVVSVRGSVVDICFERRLPPIYSVLHAGSENRVVIEVLAQRDAHHVRGIALTSHRGWRAAWTGDGGFALKRQLERKLVDHKQEND